MNWDWINIIMLENSNFEDEFGSGEGRIVIPGKLPICTICKENVTSTKVKCWHQEKQNGPEFPSYFYFKYFSKFPLDAIRRVDKKPRTLQHNKARGLVIVYEGKKWSAHVMYFQMNKPICDTCCYIWRRKKHFGFLVSATICNCSVWQCQWSNGTWIA